MLRGIYIHVLCALFSVLAAEKSAASTLRYITTTDGLTFGSVTCIMQDPSGIMWFGTIDGLNMFDGKRLYNSNDNLIGHDLHGSMVSALTTTDDGSLWIQTNEGLHRFRSAADTLGYYNEFSEFKGRSEHSQVYSSGARLYLVAPDGAVHYHEDGFTDGFRTLEGVDAPLGKTLCVDWSDPARMVVFCPDSVVIYGVRRDEGRYVLSDDKAVYQASITDCFPDGDNIWVINRRGELQNYNKSIHAFTTVADLSEEIARRNVVTDVCADRHGNILVGFKSEGVIKISEGGQKIEDTGIRSSVFDMMHDRYQDIIWIGTDGQGVIQWINDSFSIFTCMYSDLLHSIFAPTRSIYLDSTDNTLYLGTKGDGILRIDHFTPNHSITPQQLSYITTRNTSLSGNSVYVMTPGRSDVIWIGSEGGLDYLSKSDGRIHNVLNTPPLLRYIHGIIEDDENVLWAATTGLGIFRLVIDRTPQGIRIASYDCFSLPGAASNYFFTIMRGIDGNLYAGNRGEGVFRVTDRGLEQFATGTGPRGELINNEVFSLEMTSDSALWIGTSAGVLRHDLDGNETLYNAETGFPSSYIHSMYFDGTDNLWLATNAGLIRFVPSDETFQVYGRHNGMNMVEFSDGAFAECDGRLFFGGNNGIVLASRNPEVRPEAQRYHPPLIFTQLLINGEQRSFHHQVINGVHQAPDLTVGYDDNNIGIGMTVPEYINSANLELFYRMGGDHDWIRADNYYATFNRLSPGSYEIEARYRDTVTGYESEVSQLKLYVTPPWYLSWPAKLVYLAVVIVICIYVFKLFKRRERVKRLLQIEKIEREHHNQLYEQKLRFFTNITHEFCSPLTLIYGPCERLLSYEHSDNYVCRYVGLIKQNAERLNSLIQEVIDFRRLETGHRERNVSSIDVTALSNQILASFEHLAEQNSLTLKGEIGEGITFDTDASAFTKIFYNLVSNAFKYTPQEGVICVAVSVEAGSLVLSVYNTGKGISPEDQKRIFNRYEVLDNLEINATKGLSARNGLGLAICNSMVHFLDGTIDIDSRAGEYARFIVTLPPLPVTVANPASPDMILHQGDAAVSAITAESAMTASLDVAGLPDAEDAVESNGRILVVDDDRELLSMLREGLVGYTVVTASSADDAMAQMRDRLPDLVITDVMMPGRDGFSLIGEIKNNAITSHIPVIVLSAKHTSDDRVAGLRAGADAYVPKPFAFSYLLAVIERLLAPARHAVTTSVADFDYDRSKLQHYDDMKLVDDVVKYIESHLHDEKLTAATIADGLGIGLRKLYRRFQQLEQPSPSDMIREIRLARAMRLMLTTTLSMKEIITQCGYRNRGSFYKMFMKKYGMPPIAYRESITSRKIDDSDDEGDDSDIDENVTGETSATE